MREERTVSGHAAQEGKAGHGSGSPLRRIDVPGEEAFVLVMGRRLPRRICGTSRGSRSPGTAAGTSPVISLKPHEPDDF